MIIIIYLLINYYLFLVKVYDRFFLLAGVTGYLEMPFKMHIGAGGSFGTGAITDGVEFRLRVRIISFTERPDLTTGTHVKILGAIKDDLRKFQIRFSNIISTSFFLSFFFPEYCV